MTTTATPQALGASVGAFVDELVRAGVRHFCVCPGSRSTPLALTIARHPGAKLWLHLDERSAGFFALGLAKAGRAPVALVCTSGTAAANFLPAVVEAFYARVPLVVLTADRPHELRDVGAPQTIDQINLFGSHAKWFVDLAEPDAAPELLRYVRTVAGRAVATARRGPAGPVHVNCPYREPLMPDPALAAAAPEDRPAGQPYVRVAAGSRAPEPALVASLAAELAAAPRGLIVCGAQDDPALAVPLARLAAALGYPILADPLSGLRSGEHDRALVVDSYDALLRDGAFAERLAPALVLRFGAMPVSKPLLQYLQRHPACRQVVVDGDAGWNEPTLLASDVVQADGRLLCEALLGELGGRQAPREPWAAAWATAHARARAALAAGMRSMTELFEGQVFAELAALLPAGAQLYAGNSMPIRDLDTFFAGGERPIRLLGNRGANGIDGVVSSALGASAAGAGPTVLVIGDLSFYHDTNGLLAAKLHALDATIVVVNNDGGGIFSFLPQAADPEHFEALFGTPHGLEFEPVARMYGARYTRATGWDAFRTAVRAGVAGPGLHIVELPTNRDRNVALHRQLWPLVSDAIAPVVAEYMAATGAPAQ
jgi:2-succinyl-5-enolpyruvyl-6-hydroxy-3-cyclohexene-1-carboxylate synthase